MIPSTFSRYEYVSFFLTKTEVDDLWKWHVLRGLVNRYFVSDLTDQRVQTSAYRKISYFPSSLPINVVPAVVIALSNTGNKFIRPIPTAQSSLLYK